jgi:hypothetical protein
MMSGRFGFAHFISFFFYVWDNIARERRFDEFRCVLFLFSFCQGFIDLRLYF